MKDYASWARHNFAKALTVKMVVVMYRHQFSCHKGDRYEE